MTIFNHLHAPDEMCHESGKVDQKQSKLFDCLRVVIKELVCEEPEGDSKSKNVEYHEQWDEDMPKSIEN